MSSILDSPDVLAALRQQKRAVGRKLEVSRQHIIETTSLLTSPIPKATSGAQRVSRIVSSGFVIYKGFRIFSNVVSTLRSVFGHRKPRR